MATKDESQYVQPQHQLHLNAIGMIFREWERLPDSGKARLNRYLEEAGCKTRIV